MYLLIFISSNFVRNEMIPIIPIRTKILIIIVYFLSFMNIVYQIDFNCQVIILLFCSKWRLPIPYLYLLLFLRHTYCTRNIPNITLLNASKYIHRFVTAERTRLHFFMYSSSSQPNLSVYAIFCFLYNLHNNPHKPLYALLRF